MSEVSRKLQKDLQKPSAGRLSAKQRALAEAIANPEVANTIVAACEYAGVNRTSYYEWMRDCPEFVAHAEYLIDKYTDGQLGPIYKALCNKARAGNVPAIRLFFEVKGRLKKELDLNISTQDITPDEVNSLRSLQENKDGAKEKGQDEKAT